MENKLKITKILYDGREGFFIPREELQKFMAEIYVESEWYPDYIAKGKSEESELTRCDFIRGWTASDLWNERQNTLMDVVKKHVEKYTLFKNKIQK